MKGSKTIKRKKDLLNRRIEVEQEFQKMNVQCTKFKEDPLCLSYEVK